MSDETIICGVPIAALKIILSRAPFQAAQAGHYSNLLPWLEAEGWITRSPEPHLWVADEKGRELINTDPPALISASRARGIIAGVRRVARAVNANPIFYYWIEELNVPRSSSNAPVCEIKIGVKLHVRDATEAPYKAVMGRAPLEWHRTDLLHWPTEEVYRELRKPAQKRLLFVNWWDVDYEVQAVYAFPPPST